MTPGRPETSGDGREVVKLIEAGGDVVLLPGNHTEVQR